jgi:hypothetical protein
MVRVKNYDRFLENAVVGRVPMQFVCNPISSFVYDRSVIDITQ